MRRAGTCTVALLVVSTLLHPGRALADEASTCEEPSIIGKVVSVKNLRVHVDLGTKDGIEKGMRVAVIPGSAISSHPKYGSSFLCGASPEVTVIVELDEVGKEESSGIIGRTGAATKGDTVVLTGLEPTDRRGFPGFPHAYGNVFDVSLRFRILASFGGGAGFPTDLMIGYQLPIPVKIRLVMSPIFAGSHEGGHAMSVMSFMLTYSSRFFEVGFGVGGYLESFEHIRRFAFQQFFRIGAEHGMRARVTNTLVWDHGWGGGRRGLRYDSTFGEIVIPVHARVSLFWEGGGMGGNTEYEVVRVTTGVHVYARGTGGPGTIVLPIGFGGGFVFLDACTDDMCDWIDYVGLYITLGVDMVF